MGCERPAFSRGEIPITVRGPRFSLKQPAEFSSLVSFVFPPCRPAELYRAQLRREALTKIQSGGLLINQEGNPQSHNEAVEDEDPAKNDFSEGSATNSQQDQTQEQQPSKPISAVRRTSLAKKGQGASVSASKPGALGAKKLDSKVDDRLFEQAPASNLPAQPNKPSEHSKSTSNLSQPSSRFRRGDEIPSFHLFISCFADWHCSS